MEKNTNNKIISIFQINFAIRFKTEIISITKFRKLNSNIQLRYMS